MCDNEIQWGLSVLLIYLLIVYVFIGQISFKLKEKVGACTYVRAL